MMMDGPSGGAGLPDPVAEDIDIQGLHRRYLAERDKRLRSGGTAQYVAMDGLLDMVRDPFCEPAERAPVVRSVQVAILGGGLSGVMSACLLRKVGGIDLVIMENGGDFGGVWYWNRYPGARCDIESYIYMPLLEELGYVPTERYAGTSEIWEHARALGRHFDLYKDALFSTHVTDVRWDESGQQWSIETERGDRITAQFVILATGQLLSQPKLPGIPGLQTFTGRSFHASRWDYGYTGGDTSGGLEKLSDKRVAVIGTGATAVQIVPHLAEWAQHLYVFQRTPAVIDVRGNGPTDAAWAGSLEPGWQTERMANFDLVLENKLRPDKALVRDQWRVIWGHPDISGLSEEEAERAEEAYDYAQMERIRARVDEIVDDPQVAAALKPYYRRFCKRPCFNDEYLPTFNRPNVTLVDTDGRGPDRITENAVWFGGIEHAVDCIIYATGFETYNRTPSQSGRYMVTGRGGITLDDKWGGSRFESLHGLYASGFPNLFVLGSIKQSATSFNVPHRVLQQARHVTSLIGRLTTAGIQSMEVTPEAEKGWGEVIAAGGARDKALLAQMRECTPGYYNNEGAVTDQPLVIGGGFGGGTLAYAEAIGQWRQDWARVEQDLLLRRAQPPR